MCSSDLVALGLEQTGGPTQPKSDMDLSVRDASGEVWSIGSPYTDEVGTKWPADLAATMPPGDYVVRVNSYSGTDYEGDVIVVQESA